MFGRVSKIPVANAFNELVEIDFVDYGDYVAFFTFKANFRDFL